MSAADLNRLGTALVVPLLGLGYFLALAVLSVRRKRPFPRLTVHASLLLFFFTAMTWGGDLRYAMLFLFLAPLAALVSHRVVVNTEPMPDPRGWLGYLGKTILVVAFLLAAISVKMMTIDALAQNKADLTRSLCSWVSKEMESVVLEAALAAASNGRPSIPDERTVRDVCRSALTHGDIPRTAPWETPFSLAVDTQPTGGDGVRIAITVTSAGRDRREGTEDDISARNVFAIGSPAVRR